MYHRFPQYQPCGYCACLCVEMDIHVAESTVCRIFAELGLTLKEPDVARVERFCGRFGNIEDEKVDYYCRYLEVASAIRTEDLVWFDEMASTPKHDQVRKQRAPKGQTPGA